MEKTIKKIFFIALSIFCSFMIFYSIQFASTYIEVLDIYPSRNSYSYFNYLGEAISQYISALFYLFIAVISVFILVFSFIKSKADYAKISISNPVIRTTLIGLVVCLISLSLLNVYHIISIFLSELDLTNDNLWGMFYYFIHFAFYSLCAVVIILKLACSSKKRSEEYKLNKREQMKAKLEQEIAEKMARLEELKQD